MKFDNQGVGIVQRQRQIFVESQGSIENIGWTDGRNFGRYVEVESKALVPHQGICVSGNLTGRVESL